ncbi:acyltransferase family protein [Roseibium sp. M-1]
MKYNPALDGLRALAALSVVSFHARFNVTAGGWIGVDIFIVLSGYLITSIIRKELIATGTLDFKRFYVNRLTRLMPPLVIVMAFTYLLFLVLAPELDLTKDVIFSVLYISDYGHAIWGIPEYLKHTWSLAVEQHFYLIAPVLLLFSRRLSDSDLFKLLLCLFVAATLWRALDVVLYHDWTLTYYRFDTRLSGLILGSALAVCPWKPSQKSIETVSKIGLYGTLFVIVFPSWDFLPFLVIFPLLAEMFTFSLISALTSDHENVSKSIFSNRVLVYIGTISYSIYLWHYGFAFFLRDMLPAPVAFVCIAGISITLAAVCHRFIDAPVKNAWRGKLSDSENRKPAFNAS